MEKKKSLRELKKINKKGFFSFLYWWRPWLKASPWLLRLASEFTILCSLKQGIQARSKLLSGSWNYYLVLEAEGNFSNKPEVLSFSWLVDLRSLRTYVTLRFWHALLADIQHYVHMCVPCAHQNNSEKIYQEVNHPSSTNREPLDNPYGTHSRFPRFCSSQRNSCYL